MPQDFATSSIKKTFQSHLLKTPMIVTRSIFDRPLNSVRRGSAGGTAALYGRQRVLINYLIFQKGPILDFLTVFKKNATLFGKNLIFLTFEPLEREREVSGLVSTRDFLKYQEAISENFLPRYLWLHLWEENRTKCFFSKKPYETVHKKKTIKTKKKSDKNRNSKNSENWNVKRFASNLLN